MYQYKGLEDTIAAISTPSGQGGIGIIRISGKDAINVADQVFKPKSKKSISAARSYTVHYGWIADDRDEIIDEVLLTIMRGPKSYTTEDVIEISCHGGIISLRAILKQVTDKGARLAEPGEFTKRAFLNGRIDLTQAEAVLDIINSKTDAFLKVSTNQLKGELSHELAVIREHILNTYVEMEAIVNFPEDDIDSEGRKKLSYDIEKAKSKIDQLLLESDQGRILREGMKLVLCGKPNVGKSSLLNVLLKTERAIVSDVAGTTRDTIEESAQINGVPFQVIDTAGILNPRDQIEEEAIKRSEMSMQGADIVLVVLDGGQELDEKDHAIMQTVKGQNALVVINKSDLDNKVDKSEIIGFFDEKRIVNVSALNKSGVDQLRESIVYNVLHTEAINVHGTVVSNLRHIQSLKEAQTLLASSQKGLLENLSLEFVSEDLKQSVNHLDAITGKNIDVDLLDTIFSQFCIGK